MQINEVSCWIVLSGKAKVCNFQYFSHFYLLFLRMEWLERLLVRDGSVPCSQNVFPSKASRLKAVSKNLLSDTRCVFLLPVAAAAAGSRPTYLCDKKNWADKWGEKRDDFDTNKHENMLLNAFKSAWQIWTFNHQSFLNKNQSKLHHQLYLLVSFPLFSPSHQY